MRLDWIDQLLPTILYWTAHCHLLLVPHRTYRCPHLLLPIYLPHLPLAFAYLPFL